VLDANFAEEPIQGDPPPERDFVAYHEAGHSVVSYWVGMPLDRASIRGTEGSRGRVELGVYQCLSTEDVQGVIMICLAGLAAEERFAEGRELPKASRCAALGDEMDALRHAATWLEACIQCNHIDEVLPLGPCDMLARVREPTRKLVSDSNVWAAIEALAEVLSKQEEIEWPDARKIIEGEGVVPNVPATLSPRNRRRA
jgi:hypothetical protein